MREEGWTVLTGWRGCGSELGPGFGASSGCAIVGDLSVFAGRRGDLLHRVLCSYHEGSYNF